MRRAPEGAALWTPAGAFRPRPRDAYASPLRLRAGRGLGCVYLCLSGTDRPAIRTAGRSVFCGFFYFGGYVRRTDIIVAAFFSTWLRIKPARSQA